MFDLWAKTYNLEQQGPIEKEATIFLKSESLFV